MRAHAVRSTCTPRTSWGVLSSRLGKPTCYLPTTRRRKLCRCDVDDEFRSQVSQPEAGSALRSLRWHFAWCSEAPVAVRANSDRQTPAPSSAIHRFVGHHTPGTAGQSVVSPLMSETNCQGISHTCIANVRKPQTIPYYEYLKYFV